MPLFIVQLGKFVIQVFNALIFYQFFDHLRVALIMILVYEENSTNLS